MPVSSQTRTLRGLRNTRDLRAEILSLAAELAGVEDAAGRMIVIDPIIAGATIRKEWDNLLPAIVPDVRARMSLEFEESRQRHDPYTVALGKASYRYEILRMLIEADLRNEKISVKALVEQIEASQTPVRTALDELRAAGIVQEKGAALYLRPEDVTTELLAKAGALPQTLRFRFEQGSQIKPPAQLLPRCLPLLEKSPENSDWGRMALSGIAAARDDVPQIDLVGLPRLDLVAQLPHKEKQFQAGLLKQLDDGLEYEASVLASAPVVVTIVRANLMHARLQGNASVAPKADVYLSLLDMGLRDLALQYAKAVRQ